MTNERWLKWAIARYYRSKGYKVSLKPVRVGNAMLDGVAIAITRREETEERGFPAEGHEAGGR